MGDLVPQRPAKQPERKLINPVESLPVQPSTPRRNSILRQLNKYNNIEESSPIKKESLIKKDDSPPYEVSDSEPDKDTWTGTLYPNELLKAYHSVRVKGEYVSEERCDAILNKFIASCDKVKYLAQFKLAITDNIFRIIMSRILVGTFFKDKNQSTMPIRFRKISLNYLGFTTVSQDGAMRNLEEVNSLASNEEMILGRIGYLMIWKSGLSPEQLIPENYRLNRG